MVITKKKTETKNPPVVDRKLVLDYTRLADQASRRTFEGKTNFFYSLRALIIHNIIHVAEKDALYDRVGQQ